MKKWIRYFCCLFICLFSYNRFACEGLSYLSLDADVKEFIVEDEVLLQAIVALAKVSISNQILSIKLLKSENS